MGVLGLSSVFLRVLCEMFVFLDRNEQAGMNRG
jgi:hypothetical protein